MSIYIYTYRYIYPIFILVYYGYQNNNQSVRSEIYKYQIIAQKRQKNQVLQYQQFSTFANRIPIKNQFTNSNQNLSYNFQNNQNQLTPKKNKQNSKNNENFSNKKTPQLCKVKGKSTCGTAFKYSSKKQQQSKNMNNEIHQNEIENCNRNQQNEFELTQNDNLNNKEDKLIQQINPQLTFEVINKLYSDSWRQRYVELKYLPFVQEMQNEKELFKYYQITQLRLKNQLKEICNNIQCVRGDGNCFYTAFSYQYLQYLIRIDENQFQQFYNEYNNIPLQIYYKDEKYINEIQESNLRNDFFNRIINLRKLDLENRQEELFKQFSTYENNETYDSFLYGLTIIFFRSLSYQFALQSEFEQNINKNDLLIWEQDCNENEVVIQQLANKLKIQIILIFFNDGEFLIRKYMDQEEQKIILLIKPGHYNIGIQNNQ